MFPYMGGKSQHIRYLDPIFPARCERWVDVFGGAGWVTVKSALAAQSLEVIYNDANPHLANIWRWFQQDPEGLAQDLESWTWQDADLYRRFQRQIFVDNEPPVSRQTAARYLYLEVQSFSGNTLSATSSVYFDSIHTLKPLLKKLRNPRYLARLARITQVHCLDALDLIDLYDQPGTFFYVDPPYFQKEHYYTKAWSQDQHEQLARRLSACQAQWALSYYEFDQLDQWLDPNRFPRHRYNLYRPSSGRRTSDRSATELVITNYQHNNFERLFES